ncbi:MAG TPA: ribosome maturation factor RimP [Candidatus Polarisedimenticolia bacterium]|nr:ribosome maturation factor RimP [Candidatus Polarisedimenticolia bacterium]
MAPSESIEGRLRALAQDTADREGYELVDVEYGRGPSGWTVRVFLDKPGGVSLEDCGRFSQSFGTLLEVEDPIPHHFNLEVSSPGLDRPLRKQSDFQAAVGRLVKVTTARPLSGQRHFTGRLTAAGEAPGAHASAAPLLLRVLDEAGTEHAIPAEAVERAHIVYEWPELSGQVAGKGRRSGKKKR